MKPNQPKSNKTFTDTNPGIKNNHNPLKTVFITKLRKKMLQPLLVS